MSPNLLKIVEKIKKMLEVDEYTHSYEDIAKIAGVTTREIQTFMVTPEEVSIKTAGKIADAFWFNLCIVVLKKVEQSHGSTSAGKNV